MQASYSTIVLLVLGALTACRSVPPNFGTRGGDAAKRVTPVAQQQQGAKVRPVAFVAKPDEMDENPGPDILPSPQTDRRLTIGDLEAIAFQNHPALAAAAARMQAARAQQLQAGLFPNPVVGYHATEIGNLDTAGQQGGFISQRFITGGKLRLDQAIAGTDFDVAHFQFHAQERRVLSDVRVRFYDALVAQQRAALTRQLADIGADLVTATEKLTAGRLATENDLLQAEIQADESRILFDDASNERVEAWRRLVTVAGVPTMPTMPLVGELDSDLPNLDWDSCYTLVLANNPRLHIARKRVERANMVMLRARQEPIPNVDLSVSVRHHNVTQSDVANVQLGFPVPVFNKNQGNIRAAQAERGAARSDLRRIELSLQDQLAVVYRRYASARQQVDRYRERMVPKARRSLSLVTSGYETGQVKYLDLLTSQQTYLRVNLAYLDSLRELRAAATLIEGQLLLDSLGGVEK